MEAHKTNFRIELMQEADIPGVVWLEESCGLNSRGEASYLRDLQLPHSILLVAVAGQAPNQPRQVIGLFSGAVVVDELQIDNIAIAAQQRRSSLASALLITALHLARQQGAISAVLEVRAQNSAARAFYKKHGFTVAALRKAYYHQPPDDALLLTCDISKGTENAP